MLALRKRPEWLGNLGLCLFVAFLVSLWWGAPASAQTTTVRDVEVLEAGVVDGQIRVKVDLSPLTPVDEPTTLQLFFIRFGSGQFVPVQGTVYKVYGDTTAAVYGIVYLVYTVPQGFVIRPDLVSVRVYLQGTVIQAVYVTVYTPPPETPPAPPSPPPSTGAPSQPEGTQAAAGTIVVSGGTATYQVDPAKVAEQLARVTDKLVLEIPASVQVQAARVQIPPQALQAVADAGKGVAVVVAALNVAIELDAQALRGLLAQTAGQPVTLSVARAQQAPTPPAEAAFRPAGPVFELSLGASGISLPSPVRVGLPYERDRLGGVPEWKLGVYRFDEGTRQWQFVGGRVDPQAGRVIGFPTRFSRFTVMAYDVTFADMAAHWARMDVELMASKHVARGVAPGRFEPRGTVTRAQLAALVVRALQLEPQRPAQPTFADLPVSHWAFAEVEAAVAAGLVQGVAPGRFEPDRAVTREEMASVLMRALRRAGGTQRGRLAEALEALSGYVDAGQVATWARRDVAEAILYGLIQGRTPTTVAPKGVATRAEAIVMIKRLLVAAGRL